VYLFIRLQQTFLKKNIEIELISKRH